MKTIVIIFLFSFIRTRSRRWISSRGQDKEIVMDFIVLFEEILGENQGLFMLICAIDEFYIELFTELLYLVLLLWYIIHIIFIQRWDSGSCRHSRIAIIRYPLILSCISRKIFNQIPHICDLILAEKHNHTLFLWYLHLVLYFDTNLLDNIV